jgi:hypothetical protein
MLQQKRFIKQHILNKRRFLMRKLIIFYSFLFLVSVPITAQTFQFTPLHTSVTDTLGTELVFEFDLRNTSNVSQTIYIVRTNDQLPTDWTSSLCFDQGCFAPFVDSVATTPDFSSSPILPGETRAFSVHIFTSFANGTAFVTVKAVNMNNTSEFYSVDLTGHTQPTSVEDDITNIDFNLGQNYPNPFNPSTVVSYVLPVASDVSFTLYNSLGVKVAELGTGLQQAGRHDININMNNYPSGVYFYRLRSGSYTSTKKMILEK